MKREEGKVDDRDRERKEEGKTKEARGTDVAEWIGEEGTRIVTLWSVEGERERVKVKEREG